jgi:hypothetical protein
MNLILDPDDVAERHGIEHPSLLILDIDVVAEHDASVSLCGFANHSARLFDCRSAGCGKIGELDSLKIRHVHVVEEMEVEPRHAPTALSCPASSKY